MRSFPTRRGKYHLSAIRKSHNDARASKIAGFARRCKRRGPQWFALVTVCWVSWELEMPMLGDVAWILSGACAALTNEPSRNGRWRPWITARSTSKFGHYKAPLPRWRPCRKAERLGAIVTRTRRSSATSGRPVKGEFGVHHHWGHDLPHDDMRDWRAMSARPFN